MADTQPTAEEWRPVPGYEGFYEVSDCGNVRSLDRTVVGAGGVAQFVRGRQMKPHDNGTGHLCVKFRTGHQRRVALYVHRLVMAAFIGPCPDGMEVCHSDGDPSNNVLGNLRYGTVSDNRFDSVRHGTHVEARKTHCPRGHALVVPNLVANAARRGSRCCLACSRATAYLQRHPGPSKQEVSDWYHSKIVGLGATN